MPCHATHERAAPPSPPHTAGRAKRPAPSLIEPAALPIDSPPLGSWSKVLHVDISSKPRVIGQVPARMVGIFIEHNIVAVPVPVIHITQIVWSHAKIEAAEEEAVRPASVQMPDMRRSKPAGEMPMVIGMIEMVVRVTRAPIVSNPMAVLVDVRSTGVARTIAEVPIRLHVRHAVIRFGTMRWHRRMIPASGRMTAAASGVLKSPRWERKNKHCRQYADNSLHESLL